MKLDKSKADINFLVHDSNSSTRPLMTLNIKLPDNRLKLQVQNLITLLIQEMVKLLKLSESFFNFVLLYE